MFDVVRKTKKFNTDEQEDLDFYDALLSNPLCSVISEQKEKLRTEQYDEGKLIHSEEHIIKVVTWEEKVIA